MSKKVLIRKQAGSGGIMYTREVGGRGQGGLMQDLAAVRGGARGLHAQGQQSFIPGAQLGDAKPTGMQRLAAGANIAGRGLAAALTGLQTAYSLQGGNVGALGNIADNYAATVPGLTANRPTEAQQTQDMATEAFNTQQQQMAQQAMMQQATPPRQGNLTVGVAPPTHSSSPATPAPATPPAGLATPPTSGVPPSHPGFAFSHTQTYPAPAQAAPATPSITPTNAAQMLPTLPQQTAAPTTPSITPTDAAQMLPSVSQQPTSPTVPTASQPPYSGPMPVQQSAPPVAVSQPVDNGLTPTELPVLMPQQQTHEQQRVAVRSSVEAPYKPNQFFNPTGQKPGHAYNTGQYTPTQRQYGLSDKKDYRNRAMPANFGDISWDSAEPSLGDDPSINWDDFKRAFVSQVFDEFGDMLHKADPHTVGAVAMRVFLEKMLRK
jgi:hypothetical protein